MGDKIGKNVILICEVVSITNGGAVVRAPDGMEVNISNPSGELLET